MTSKSQKILVLGATGSTGRLVVTDALARGHAVTVFARSAEKAKPLKPTDIVLGDATDEAVLRRAVRGQDAVISVLGTPASPFRRVTTLSTATRVLIRAMEAEGTSRLVAVTGIGAGDSRGHGGALFDLVLRPLILRNVYADKDRQEALIRGSSLDWTIVRPAILNDHPATGRVRALTDLSGIHGGGIPRADVARFLIDEIDDGTFRGRALLIMAE